MDLSLNERVQQHFEPGPGGLILRNRPNLEYEYSDDIDLTYRNITKVRVEWGQDKQSTTGPEVGFSVAQKPKAVIITDIYVPQLYRGQGLWGRILDRVEGFVASEGITEVKMYDWSIEERHRRWLEQHNYSYIGRPNNTPFYVKKLPVLEPSHLK